MDFPVTQVRTLLLVLDLCGTFVFALSGAMAGIKHRLDLFGVLVLSFAAGAEDVVEQRIGVQPADLPALVGGKTGREHAPRRHFSGPFVASRSHRAGG